MFLNLGFWYSLGWIVQTLVAINKSFSKFLHWHSLGPHNKEVLNFRFNALIEHALRRQIILSKKQGQGDACATKMPKGFN